MPTARERTVFYSWQSDLPNRTNRGLIRAALDIAVERLSETVDEPVRADSDTQGVGGVRDIHQVILDKLDACDAAVFDVTPVVKMRKGNRIKKLPNANVMLELGYGLVRPGANRLVLVLNTAQGTVEQLPFDIRNRPVATYRMRQRGDAPAAARNELAGKLRHALETILRAPRVPELSLADRTVAALREAAANRLLMLEEFYDALANELRRRRPEWNEAEWEARVTAAYRDALPLTQDFAKVTAIAARQVAEGDLLPKLIALFGRVFSLARRNREEANAPQGLCDFENLMARELFIVAVDCLAEAGKFQTLNAFFAGEYHVDDRSLPIVGPFWRVMEYTNIAVHRWNERVPLPNGARRTSPMGEWHKMRFTGDAGAAVIPFGRFRGAEILAYLRSDRDVAGAVERRWSPCCMVFTSFGPPALFENARTRHGARALAVALGFGDDLAAFRQFWADARQRADEWWMRAGTLYFHPEWIQADAIAQ